MFHSNVYQRDKNWLDLFQRRIHSETTHEVAVGYPSGEGGVSSPHYENGESIVSVAIKNNFGDDGNPRRPFMDNASPKMKHKFKNLMSQLQPKINAGQTDPKTALEVISLMGENEVRKAIDSGDFVPNSPKTIAIKGSSKPLIDSGDMRKYVTSVVRKRSS